MALNVDKIRSDFPILKRKVNEVLLFILIMQQLVKNQIKLLTVFRITTEIITQISTEEFTVLVKKQLTHMKMQEKKFKSTLMLDTPKKLF